MRQKQQLQQQKDAHIAKKSKLSTEMIRKVSQLARPLVYVCYVAYEQHKLHGINIMTR